MPTIYQPLLRNQMNLQVDESIVMFPIERALLIINTTAGTGRTAEVVEPLCALFQQSLGGLSQVEVELVSGHSAARTLTTRFIQQSERPTLAIAAGGGGTLRAVIEGICNANDSPILPGPQRVRVGALRMGSGNLLARQLGVPHDPLDGLHGLLSNLKSGSTVPCCVMRCEISNASGHSEVHYAVTLGGFGQFGRIPSDLACWHSRFPSVHKCAARLFGIEAFTDIEYLLTLLIRSIGCVLLPQSAETIDVCFSDRKERLQLLSGIMMNFPIKALPFKPAVRVEDQSVAVYLVPFKGRFSPLLQLFAPQRLIPHTRYFKIERDQSLEIRLVDRNCVQFFLDEDPIKTFGRLTLSVAGSVAFVPGPDYQPIAS